MVNKKQYLFLIIIGLITYILPMLSIHYEMYDGWLGDFIIAGIIGLFGVIGMILLFWLLIVIPIIWIFKLIWEKLENE